MKVIKPRPSYHKRFKLSDPVLLPTRLLFDSHLLSKKPDEQEDLVREWAEAICKVYKVTEPVILITPHLPSVKLSKGLYLPAVQTIALDHMSYVTLFHEFRHHWQHVFPRLHPSKYEDDARAWSLSLFYQARPKLFEKSVLAGKIQHIKPSEL